jgi:HPt (histidine-containing phosphotransfer) domain-containing protein
MENNKPRYDIKGLAEELEFEIEDISGLFSSFFEEMETDISSMEEYLGKKDWNMMERVVHNIKGVSANLSVTDVNEEAAVFNALLKQNKTEDAEFHVKRLASLLVGAEEEIRKIFMDMDIKL